MPSATWLREVEAAQRVFKVKESEHTWQSFDTTLLKLQQLINSLVTQDLSPALIVAGLKDLRVPLNACVSLPQGPLHQLLLFNVEMLG